MEIDVELYRRQVRVTLQPPAWLSVIDIAPDQPQRTMLFVHGFGGNARQWKAQLRHYSSFNRVIAVDLRGHGHSDKPLYGYDLVTLADDVCALLDAVGVESAVLVGSSSGGYIAQQVAVATPDRVSGLVLAGVPFSLAGRPAIADEIDGLVDPISRSWARGFVDWFAVESEIPDGYLAERVQDALAIPAEVWRLSLAGLTESRPPLRSGQVTTPTLAIWGDADALIPSHDQEALVAAIPGARRVVYEGVGHFVLWEQPARLAGDVAAFVAGLATAPIQAESS
jgi:rifampin ADP-ribosylating transferase